MHDGKAAHDRIMERDRILALRWSEIRYFSACLDIMLQGLGLTRVNHKFVIFCKVAILDVHNA